MPTNTWLLPYPAQLPQDYFNKNYPVAAPVTPSVPTTPSVSTPAPPISVTINSGGVYYGPTPPASPQYGWLWTMGQGRLFVYMEPGVWTQVSTNW